ncbi:MAG: hypothetical protein HY769_08650 [Candidatus Stahlbacteria bacterium]|nr:hypothetical protein [Candidatus Stahlbacteria bacterium]
MPNKKQKLDVFRSPSSISRLMSNVFCLMSPVFCLLSFYGCQEAGGVRDIALLRQAQRELKTIRNALEEYKIDHNTYPAEGSNLDIVLAPYISKIIYSEGKDMPIYTKATLSAKAKGEASPFAIIVQSQSILHRMADAIGDYRREKGKFPESNVDIDSILHPYFIETTMSGQQIDRWQEALKWFSSKPIYKTQNPDVEFELEATVNKTLIISKMRVLNQWSEIISTFADNSVVYTTSNPTATYFLKSRARDSGLTWVTERPHKG